MEEKETLCMINEVASYAPVAELYGGEDLSIEEVEKKKKKKKDEKGE